MRASRGSWNNNAQNCRVSNRNNNTPTNRNNNLGFRPVRQRTGMPDGFRYTDVCPARLRFCRAAVLVAQAKALPPLF
jgi:hypothetical protein